jgi:hypothetical protein
MSDKDLNNWLDRLSGPSDLATVRTEGDWEIIERLRFDLADDPEELKRVVEYLEAA